MNAAHLSPMTDRIRRVREAYRRTPVASQKPVILDYGNHALTLHWLEGYLEARSQPTTLLRRSHALAYELDHSAVIIEQDELLVGQTDFAPNYEQPERFAALADMYRMSPNISPDGRSDHMALDIRKLLRVGVDGLIAEIEAEQRKLTFSRETMLEDTTRSEFYDAALVELRALLRYAARYEARLRQLAETAASPRREELLTMADNLRQVPKGPAQTFWQALQSAHFYTFVLRGLYSGGRPDQDLLPYYEADRSSSSLSEAFAQELIDNYCLSYSTYVFPNTAAGMMVCGTDEDGAPVENDLSWMFLAAVDHIRMPDPNLGLCITDSTDPDLIRYGLDMIGRGCTFPSFWNDGIIVEALTALGFAPRDAHRYINSTCVELTIIGKSGAWTTAPYHNLALLLREVFLSGPFPDYPSLEKAYLERVRTAFADENCALNRIKLERSRNPSEPMLHSCLVDDCIRRGRPVGNGGPVYAATLPNVLGFANAVDGLSAIRELVFERGEVAPEVYQEAVRTNYADCELLRQSILHRTAHYGNGEPGPDGIAATLAECMREVCKQLYTLHGDILIPGIFSFFYHVYYGSFTPATPDGRLSGTPLADSAGPAQGRDTHSPTAALLSGTAWPQSDFLGGVAQNLRLSAPFFADQDKAAALTLLDGFFQRGGCELQLNCFGAEELEDAIRNPEAHGDLLVRVGGYSDFFVNMSPELQQEILSRTSY